MNTSEVEEIHNVSHGFFSLARYTGTCKINGVLYVYDPMRDVLVREDIVKKRAKEAKAKKKRALGET